MVLVKLAYYMKKRPNRYIFITLQISQLQIDQRLQQRTRYIEPDRRERVNNLTLIGKGKDFLNRTS